MNHVSKLTLPIAVAIIALVIPALLWSLSGNVKVAILIASLLLVSGFLIWYLPVWQVGRCPEVQAEKRAELEDGFRRTTSQVIGGMAFVFTLLFSWAAVTKDGERLDLERDATYASRFLEAARVLENCKPPIPWSPCDNLAQSVGAIYVIDHIADLWPSQYRVAAVRLLSTYVRINASLDPATVCKDPGDNLPDRDGCPALRPHVVAALEVLTAQETKLSAETDHNPFSYGSERKVAPVHPDLSKVDFRRAYLKRSKLAEAFLRESDFTGAILECADLQRSDLKDAILDYADLIEADLRKADLQGARLRGADLRGADLRGAKKLTEAQLAQACIDQKTELPMGITLSPAKTKANCHPYPQERENCDGKK